MRDCWGYPAPQAGVSVSLTAHIALSSPIQGLPLLFSLPTIHYSSTHSSLASLCHPLELCFFFFSVYSSSWLPPFDSQPCLTVALSWTCTLLPSGSFSLHKAGPFMSRGLTLHNVCFVLGVQSQTETGAGVFLVALACLHQASHCSVCLRVQPCHSRLSPPAADPADFQTEPETTKQESHEQSSKGCHLL